MTSPSQLPENELREKVRDVFIELEHNLADPKELFGYGHAVECVMNLFVKDRKAQRQALAKLIEKIPHRIIDSEYSNDTMKQSVLDPEEYGLPDSENVHRAIVDAYDTGRFSGSIEMYNLWSAVLQQVINTLDGDKK